MISEKITILTIDLEDWFHILDNAETRTQEDWGNFSTRIPEATDTLLDQLDKHNVRATFFVLGWVAAQHPDVVRKVHEAGHEIACHSNMHQLVYEQTPDEFRRDLEDAVANIEAACGLRPTAYRAPGFSITKTTPWAFDILADMGFEYDCSIFPVKRSHGGFESYGKGVPSIVRSPSGRKIREFPMSSTAILGRSLVFGGGGYFRLIPGWIGRALFRRADYNMTYFHLRDFDTDQPMVPGLSLVRRFKSYVGISGAAMKLDRMLNNFEMITLSEAAARIEWDNVQIFCCDGTLMRQSAEIGRNEP